MVYISEGIHLVIVGRQNPLDEFHRTASDEFPHMVERINDRIVSTFNAKVSDHGLELADEIRGALFSARGIYDRLWGKREEDPDEES